MPFMKRLLDIIGLPVIEVSTAKQLGEVEDFVVGSDWRLQGILLGAKHWFSSPKFIYWDNIISFGEDAVTIPNEAVLESNTDFTEAHFLVSGSAKIKGLPVITVNGIQLGMVEDVYFEGNMGKNIIGYELSDGFISDLQEGRKWLRAPDKLTIGEEAIIVPVHCEQNLEKIITTSNE
jgi:uncharacterized protein YrrD